MPVVLLVDGRPSAQAKPARAQPPTNITLFDRDLPQVLQVAVTGLPPEQPIAACW